MHTSQDSQTAEKQRSLVAPLARVRRRLLALGTVTALSWGVIAAALTLAAAVWLDLLWELAPRMRTAALAISATAGLLLAVALVVALVRRAGSAAMARRLDVAGRTGGQIVTGLELSRGLKHATAHGDATLSSALAQLSVGRAAQVAATVPTRDAVSSRPLRRSLLGLVALAVVVGLVVLAFPTAAQTQWKRFANPTDDVPPFSRLTFNVTPGNAEVVYGEGLDIFVTVGGAGAQTVERVELVIAPEGSKPTAAAESETEALPMFAEGDGRWRAVLTRITQPARYHVRAHGSRSQRFNLGVITVPRIEKVRLKITPPQYAHLPVYEGALPKGGIAGLAGTRVQFVASSNRPLSGGRVKFTSGDKNKKQASAEKAQGAGTPGDATFALTPSAAGATEVSGEFTLSSSGTFKLELEDMEGQVSREPYGGSVVLVPDQRPFIRLLRPKPVSLATPNSTVPVEVSAEDDCGLVRMLVYRSLNESRDLALDVPMRRPADKVVRQTTLLSLSQYGLSPGDVIKIFARVEDNDPAGAKGAETPVATINIISQEDFEKMVRRREGLNALTSKYQQAARQAEQLASEVSRLKKKLAKEPPNSQAAKETRRELEELEQKFAEAAAALQKAANHKLPYDVDNNLGRHLERLARQMKNQSEKLRQLRRLEKLTNGQLAEQLSPLADEFSADREEFDKEVSELMDELTKVFPLVADESRFEAVVRRQEDLARRAASLKGHDNEVNPAMKARMRDFEEEQRAIRTELDQLLDEIIDHVEQLPEGERFQKLRDTATKFVKEVRNSGAGDAMSEAESAWQDFGGTRGHEQAARAAEILKKFLKSCQGMAGEGRGCLVFSPGRAKALGDTIDQLLGEMGMKPGMGQGQNGGYSARSNSLQNVGLYGDLPSDSGSGQDENQPQQSDSNADVAGGVGGANPDHQPGSAPAADAAASTGAATNLVPPQYRRRVGQYLQRVSEESGGR